MTKCLITGGAGFIGSHLVEACLENGFEVLVLDDLSTGRTENLPMGHPRLRFFRGDIRDRALLKDIGASNSDIDYVFHLAAIASVIRSMEDPVLTHEVNYQGTLYLMEGFRGRGVKKFVYASSAAIYGNTPTMPLKESCLPRPQSPYGADKLAGEHLLKIYNDAFDEPTVACRFFNVFGERQDPSSPYSGVISIFFDRAFDKKRGSESFINIFGDGKQTRDFIYVRDIVSALLHVALDKNISGDVFNVGYGQKTTVLELVKKIQALLGIDLPTRFEKPREGEARHSQADIGKLKSTGYTFSHNFDIGLLNLAQWLEKHDR